MQIAIRFGLLITAGVAAWILIAHTLVPNPCSSIHTVGAPGFFNLLEISFIFIGLTAQKREQEGRLDFKAGLKTGMGIALVYGLSSCLFFLAFLWVTGVHAMCAEAALTTRAFWQVAIISFVGLFLGAILLGLLYSTIVAFVLATRRKTS